MDVASVFAAPPVVYALAVLPAVLWGLSPVLLKRGLAAGGTPLQAVLVTVSVDGALFWAALVALRGPAALPPLSVPMLAPFGVAGILATAVGRLAVYLGIERLGASVNSAALGCRPLFAAGFAVVFLGERVTATTLAGIGVLTVGLVILALGRGGDVRGWSSRSLGFPVGAAALFAAGTVLRRFGLETASVGPLEGVAVNETTAFVLLAAFAWPRRDRFRAAPRESYVYFAAAGVVTAVGFVAVFAALDHPSGRVAIVDPLVATAPLFAAVFARRFLGDLEEVTTGVAVGAVLIVVGAVLVTVSGA